MNSKEYLEYKGGCLAEKSLFAYSETPGSDLYHALEKVLSPSYLGIPADPSRNMGCFCREYVIYRFYLASRVLSHDPFGMGSNRFLLDGLKEALSDLPFALRASVLAETEEEFPLFVPVEILSVTPELLKERFAVYRTIEDSVRSFSSRREALTAVLRRSLARLAALAGFTLTAGETDFLLEETRAFRSFLLKELHRFTPETIHESLRNETVPSRTSLSEAAGLLCPFCTVLAGMAAGLLMLFA